MNSGRIALSILFILALAVMLMLKTTTMPSGYAATSQNQSTTASVTVNGFVSATLFKTPITFPSLDPGVNNTPASNNNMTIQIDGSTNTGTMIYLNGSDFVYTSYSFKLANMSYNVTASATGTANTSCTTTRCRYGTVPTWFFNETAASLPKNNTVGDYIDIPTSQTPGAYSGNVRICVQQQDSTIYCA
jgi:hypothetical protein